jgi:hypothetical protein
MRILSLTSPALRLTRSRDCSGCIESPEGEGTASMKDKLHRGSRSVSLVIIH